MNKKLFYKIFSILILFYLVVTNISLATTNPIITKDPASTVIFQKSGRHYAFPDCVYLSNGDLIVVCANGTDHNSPSSVEARISHNNGTTWTAGIVVQSIWPTGGGRTANPAIVQMPNKTVFCAFMAYNANNSCRYKTSNDYGVTWGSVMNFSTGSQKIWLSSICQFVTVGNTVYATAWRYMEPYPYNNRVNSTLIKTTNNGTTWTIVNMSIWNSTSKLYFSEWGFVPLNNTHFLGVFRGENGNFSPYQAESFDAGVHWTNWKNIMGYSAWEIDPKLYWLNQAHNVVVLLGGNQKTTASSSFYRNNTAWITINNGTTWQNKTVYTYGKNGGDAGYMGFAQRSDWTSKGIVVYYNGTNSGGAGYVSSIYMNHLYDNRTYFSPPVPPPVIGFISIDNNSNNSFIRGGTPSFIWNKMNDTEYYQLQISNVSDFSIVTVNITDVNEVNYPVEYSENATRVTFKLPALYALPVYNRYYFRVRSYSVV